MINQVDRTLNLNIKLKEYGLEENAIELYLELLRLGKLTLSELSRKTNIPKTTTHDNVNRLIEKGLVTKVHENNCQYIVAESPDKLKNLLFEKKLALENKIKKIENLEEEIPLIKKTVKSILANSFKQTNTFVKTYRGKIGFRAVCNQSLDKAKGEILFLSNHNYWRKVFTEEYDSLNYVPTRIKKNIKMKSLVIRNEEGQKLSKLDKGLLRETRFLPDNINLDTTFIIYHGEVSLMISSKPYIAINVQSKVIFDSFESIFYNLWEQAKN